MTLAFQACRSRQQSYRTGRVSPFTQHDVFREPCGRELISFRGRVTSESRLESLIPSPSLYLATERDLKNFLVLPEGCGYKGYINKWRLLIRHLYTERLAHAIVELKPVFVANSSAALSPKEGSRVLAYMAGVVLGFVDPASNVRTAPFSTNSSGCNALREFGSSRLDNTEHAR